MSLQVSIGIPFYNADSYLGFAIKSVIAQSYKHWELYLLDDGSTDGSLEVAKLYAEKDNRIIVVSDGKNKGLPSRLNQLNDIVTSNYYCRMDADDIMHPERIEKQLNYLINHPEVDLVGTGLIAIDNSNQIIGLRKGYSKKRFKLSDIMNGGWCVHPTIMGKTDWFKANRYDEALKRAQDYDLWLRTIEKSNFTKIEEPYLFYREASTPTIRKYFNASKHAIDIYWKNKKILGISNSLKLTIINLVKFGVYLFYGILGQTDLLIKRRSIELDQDSFMKYQRLLTKIVQ